MNIDDIIDYASDKGAEDGLAAKPYSPPIVWGICEESDEAYMISYWFAFAFVSEVDDRRTYHV